MTAQIIRLPVITRLDTNPDLVLESAVGELESVVIIGFTKEGEEYFASSVADGGTALWMVERFKKKKLLEVPEEMS